MRYMQNDMQNNMTEYRLLVVVADYPMLTLCYYSRVLKKLSLSSVAIATRES